jgi:hypothetical protein
MKVALICVVLIFGLAAIFLVPKYIAKLNATATLREDASLEHRYYEQYQEFDRSILDHINGYNHAATSIMNDFDTSEPGLATIEVAATHTKHLQLETSKLDKDVAQLEDIDRQESRSENVPFPKAEQGTFEAYFRASETLNDAETGFFGLYRAAIANPLIAAAEGQSDDAGNAGHAFGRGLRRYTHSLQAVFDLLKGLEENERDSEQRDLKATTRLEHTLPWNYKGK